MPRQASYVGHFGSDYVWIMPEGIEGLSNLTLAILDIATRDDAESVPVEYSGPSRGLTGPPGVSRRNFQVPPVGPVFTPGGH